MELIHLFEFPILNPTEGARTSLNQINPPAQVCGIKVEINKLNVLHAEPATTGRPVQAVVRVAASNPTTPLELVLVDHAHGCLRFA